MKNKEKYANEMYQLLAEISWRAQQRKQRGAKVLNREINTLEEINELLSKINKN